MDSVPAAAVEAPAGEAPRRRPVWVWIITIYYFLSAGFTVVSLLVVLSGAVPVTQAQQQYFASLRAWDYVLAISLGVLTLTGSALLFTLRRQAVLAFAACLLLNIGYTAVHTLTTNWTVAVGRSGLVGMVLAWVVLGSVTEYARRLAARGVLR